mmetsp:Transcript_118789/g.206868  ORF Transcript_118789/g.206868 Transcript_118789/m.206868 type:complete len:242 (-) Transcript_118789:129-854(-)
MHIRQARKNLLVFCGQESLLLALLLLALLLLTLLLLTLLLFALRLVDALQYLKHFFKFLAAAYRILGLDHYRHLSRLLCLFGHQFTCQAFLLFALLILKSFESVHHFLKFLTARYAVFGRNRFYHLRNLLCNILSFNSPLLSQKDLLTFLFDLCLRLQTSCDCCLGGCLLGSSSSCLFRPPFLQPLCKLGFPGTCLFLLFLSLPSFLFLRLPSCFHQSCSILSCLLLFCFIPPSLRFNRCL